MSKLEIIERARQEQRFQLTEVEAKEVARDAGIPVVPTSLARSQAEAVGLSKEIGFPVVLKIVSPDIIHKSDVGGVKLGLSSAAQVRRAYRDIMEAAGAKCPEARILGIAVQKMAAPGVEVIVGMTKDAQFGPVLMFGLGGVLVEVLKDISFRIVPLTRRDVSEMIREVKGFPLLQGYRGREGVSLDVLEDIILKVGALVENTPEIKELDLNPTIAYKDSALVVDARIILES